MVGTCTCTRTTATLLLRMLLTSLPAATADASESCCDRTKWWRNETRCATVAFTPLLALRLDVASFSINSAATSV